MAGAAPVHFVFVDYENVPDVDLDLVRDKPADVTLLIGKNQKKLELPLVKQLIDLREQVRFIEVGASGHNALDLTLAYYLGQAAQQWPEAQFHIVSKDRDFEPMIGHLATNGIKVKRSDAFHLLSFLPRSKATSAAKTTPAAKTPPVTKSAEDRSAKVTARLLNPNSRNRPGDEPALRAYIKTALGKESSAAKVDDIVRKLRDSGVTIDANRNVSYSAPS